jgi:erythromycin esterase
MVVFGFAFNRGSFQAIGGRGGGLQEFTVGPAPSGSFDAMLGSAGLPVFALDLRNAPVWFMRPRASRQIGSMFSYDTEAQYRATGAPASYFDAVLFVENTTRARPNSVRR